ncbi:MAG: ATP-grasp domain-containing protein [Deltaproteobacteria bacterium]|nr:MAG: ATP-grasp domain-containing protein [Deltaproteobacteria bacterium]
MTTKKLGIIGGGQLACLLFQSAQKLKIPTLLFVDDRNSPAFTLGYPCMVGDLYDDDFKIFIDSVDVITFENEWVNIQELQKYSSRKEFYPTLSTLEILQDKIYQKNILTHLHVPTAPFEIIKSPENITSSLKNAQSVFGHYILKWSRYGYDGKGVCFSHEEPATLIQFCEEAFQKNAQVYIEAKIQFKKELALVCARGQSGDFLLIHWLKLSKIRCMRMGI